MSSPNPPQHPSGPPQGRPGPAQQPYGPPPGFQPPAGPPPGYQQAGPPYGPPAQPGPTAKAVQLVWWLGLVSVLAVILGLSLDEDGHNQWSSVNAWGGLAIAGAALTLAPAALRASLTPQRAWQVSACGAGALVLFWVLFTLPSVGSNTSLLVTIGVAAGVVSTWVAPGRETTQPGPAQRHTW